MRTTADPREAIRTRFLDGVLADLANHGSKKALDLAAEVRLAKRQHRRASTRLRAIEGLSLALNALMVVERHVRDEAFELALEFNPDAQDDGIMSVDEVLRGADAQEHPALQLREAAKFTDDAFTVLGERWDDLLPGTDPRATASQVELARQEAAQALEQLVAIANKCIKQGLIQGPLPDEFSSLPSQAPAVPDANSTEWMKLTGKTLEAGKEEMMAKAVARHGGNQTAAAKDLNIDRTTLGRFTRK
jgi:hypothetical protein